MKCNYPKGAISSIEEMNKYKGQTLWEVSRKFTSISGIRDKYNSFVFTGNTGIDKHDTFEYHWFEVEEHNKAVFKRSFIDRHLPWQDYNDWFLFPSKSDAEAYVRGGQ